MIHIHSVRMCIAYFNDLAFGVRVPVVLCDYVIVEWINFAITILANLKFCLALRVVFNVSFFFVLFFNFNF